MLVNRPTGTSLNRPHVVRSGTHQSTPSPGLLSPLPLTPYGHVILLYVIHSMHAVLALVEMYGLHDPFMSHSHADELPVGSYKCL